jgi:energy-coupling factor transporter ATP-binding protein EcfA2
MAYDPQRITFFAETDARGRRAKFGIKAEDRTRHVYVIGKTGMGKSTLLENMAVQDIQNGEGMAFIDPHGSTAEKIMEYIPEHRMKDVLYFAPFDMENPISFNVMEDVGPDKRHLVVSGLMSTFKKIWVDAWSARMEYILSNTLLALLEYPGSTLLGVNRMLSDKDYRNAVVANIKDPSVRSFWVDEFAKYNERYMQEAGDAIKNKIGQFTANPLIRNIIGQPTSSFDVRQFMDEKKILIVNLSKGLIGETNANLLGSMLITRIYLSAMSRADIPAAQLKQMPNFYFYVDEFQSFANEAFANILSEARKYKLNLTIAHQYIEQMEEEVRNAVFGNVGTTIAFRVGPFDAEVLETIFSPEFMATDIVNLGFAQIYLTLMIDGIGSRPFSAVTLPPIPQSKVSFKDIVLVESRRQYAQPRAVIEASIAKWHEPLPKPEAPKKDASRPDVKGVLAPHAARETVSTHAPAPTSRDTQTPRTETSRPYRVPTPTAPTHASSPTSHEARERALEVEPRRETVTPPVTLDRESEEPLRKQGREPSPTDAVRTSQEVRETPHRVHPAHEGVTHSTPPGTPQATSKPSADGALSGSTAHGGRPLGAQEGSAASGHPPRRAPHSESRPTDARDARPPRSGKPSGPPHKHQHMRMGDDKKSQHLADLKAVLATLSKPTDTRVVQEHVLKPDLRSALKEAMRERVGEKTNTEAAPRVVVQHSASPTVPDLPPSVVPLPSPAVPLAPLQSTERTSAEAHANAPVVFTHKDRSPDPRAEERKSLEKLERILKGRH